MKVLTVVGARPQFVKAAALSAALRPAHAEILVHTGQHYDHGMSEVFFRELGIPAPDHHLGIGSGPHGAQTGAMLAAVERVLTAEAPDLVLVYGDTNSTLAGALAAAKLQVPVAHVEAGLRSFNRGMPEEVNRIVADHLSTLLFAPSETSRQQLASEGIVRGVHVVGDIMLDAVLAHRERAAERSRLPGAMGLVAGEYFVATLHRAENVDSPERLGRIVDALSRLERPVVLPLHPRTAGRLREHRIAPGPNVRLVEPLGYLDMLQLSGLSACVLTDSGGLQKEAYFLGVPCVTLREETEWVETVETGWNVLAGSDAGAIAAAVRRLPSPDRPRPAIYGDGRAAERIVAAL